MIAFHYKTFYEVASNLSFSKAAENLFISQPAVSKNIKKLEEELEVALFERQGSRIALTSSGKGLLAHLQKAVAVEKEINSDLDIFKSEQHARGELKVGASTTISLYVLPKVLSAFHKKYPLVKILLINRNSENVLNALNKYEIDLAIIEGHSTLNSLEYLPFITDEIIPICAQDSPFAHGKLKVADLKDIPIVMRERGSGTQSVLVNALEAKGLRMADLNIIARLGGTEAMKNYLLEDTAVGFLSRRAVDKELKSGLLREISIKGLNINRPFTFAIRKGEGVNGFIKDLIKEAKHSYS